MEQTITVWMVEDNELYRDTVVDSFKSNSKVTIPHAFPSCELMLTHLGKNQPPDLLLMDIGLPGMSGIEGVKTIKESFPELYVVMFTVYQDDDRIFQALCNGASGYLLKNSKPKEIEKAIVDAVNGGAPINPQIAKKVLNMLVGTQAPENDYGLTEREKEILELLVDGLPKKNISSKLYISYHTVDTHIKNIYTKLQVHSGNEAVAKALRENLI